MIFFRVVGAELVGARFKAELREFRREQRVQMRRAANFVKKQLSKKLASGSPLKQGQRFDSKGYELGPLHKKIRARVKPTATDVQAFIEYNRRGFYGRFHETGISKAVVRGGKRPGAYFFRLPKRPVLAPVAESSEHQIIEILGDSYGVFFRGGA